MKYEDVVVRQSVEEWRRPLLFLVLVGVLLAGCVTFPRAADDGGPPWIQVESPHFRLATDMDAPTAEEISQLLERWWQAMTLVVAREQGLGHGDEESLRPHDPFLAIALRSQRELHAVHYHFGGVFKTFWIAPPAISIGDVSDDDGLQTVRHELAHAFLRTRLPRIPRWLNEGMAVYLQTAEIDEHGHAVTWGGRNISFTRTYRELGTSVTIDRLLDPENWQGIGYGAMEFHAGLLVHMLVNRHPAELGCFLRRLEMDVDLAPAFASCFLSRAKWPVELDDYTYSSFETRTAPFELPPIHPHTTSLGDASTHAVLAILDLVAASILPEGDRGQHEQRARGNIRRALALDPNQLLGGLLKLEEPDLDRRAYADLSATLAKSHPDQWRAWIARSWADGISDDERMHAGQEAFRLAPDEMEVLQVAAIRSLVQRKWGQVHALGRRAWLKGACGARDRAVMAVAAGQLGRCPESRSWAPVGGAEKAAFTESLARMHAGLGLQDPCL